MTCWKGTCAPLDGALAQIDLAFVRKDSALRSQAAYFSPDQLADYLKTSDASSRREQLTGVWLPGC